VSTSYLARNKGTIYIRTIPVGTKKMMTSVVLMLLAGGALVEAVLKLTEVSSLYLPFSVTPDPQYKMGSEAVEQMTFDTRSKLVYVAGNGILHVVNATDVTRMERVTSMEMPGLDLTDIELCGDVIFVTVANKSDPRMGRLMVYTLWDDDGGMEVLHSIDVGSLPDMLQPFKDCRTVVIALEAEGYYDQDNVFKDPEGGVIIVKFPEGPEAPFETVSRVDFREYNNYESRGLKEKGVRFVTSGFNNNSFSNDVEPEYVALDEEAGRAYVCLQENNAVAEVDLAEERVTAIHGLGYKQWGHLDASNNDGGIAISYWPIRALALPDALLLHHWGGRRLLMTANEGDAKYEDGTPTFTEEVKGKDIPVDQLGSRIPKFVKDALANPSCLGSLRFSSVDGRDSNGTYEALYTYGGRSFSIYDATEGFRLHYDSGSIIEEKTALYCPWLFNADAKKGVVDSRSDNKGPESESLATAELYGRLYIFVGNERPGTIAVFSIGTSMSDVRFESMFCDGWPDDGRSPQQLFDARKLFAMDPEDIKFYPSSQSPAPYPILFVAGTVSGTLSVLKVEGSRDADDVGHSSNDNTCGCHSEEDDDDDDDDCNSGGETSLGGMALVFSIITLGLMRDT